MLEGGVGRINHDAVLVQVLQHAPYVVKTINYRTHCAQNGGEGIRPFPLEGHFLRNTQLALRCTIWIGSGKSDCDVMGTIRRIGHNDRDSLQRIAYGGDVVPTEGFNIMENRVVVVKRWSLPLNGLKSHYIELFRRL